MGGKYDLVQQWQLPPRMEYTESSPLNGAAIAQGSIPPNRIIIRELSALTANLGSVTAGDLIIGDVAGARVHIGSKVDGIICTDDQNRRILSFTRENGLLSIGVKSGDGGAMMYTDTDARLRIEGDAIINGTLLTDALILPGPISSTFLTSDEIRIGAGTPGTDFDGFRVGEDAIGYFVDDSAVWEVDGNTGLIVTRDVTYPGIIYTAMGDGYISISNYQEAGNRHAIKFLGYVDVTLGGGDTEIQLSTQVDLWAAYGRLIVEQKLENGRSPEIELRRDDGEQGGLWTGDTLQLRQAEASDMMQMYIMSGVSYVKGDDKVLIMPSGGSGYTGYVVCDNATGVGIGNLFPDTALDVSGAITLRELSADPDDPDEGAAVMWMSDGTETGDDGDVLIKSTAGGVTKVNTIHDHSAGA